MGATAYAGLVSLMNVITRYQHPTCPVSFNKLQMQTLLEKVGVLVEFLENYYHPNKTRSKGSIEVLERNMISAAYAAEDTIESSYVNRVLQRERLDLYPDLHEAIHNMDQIIQQAMCVGVKKHKKNKQEGHESKLKDPLPPIPISYLPISKETADNNISVNLNSFRHPRGDNIVVGLDEPLNHLMNRVTTHNPGRQIIPIVGMGGIGKTTLARNIYDHAYVDRLFDTRAWVTISQHYAVNEIIHAILHNINVYADDELDDEELGNRLYKGLWGRKYLIILDDIWSKDAWGVIMRFFPENCNGSRILITTRRWDVAGSVGSSSTYEMEALDDYNSFDLLSETIYGAECFPLELMELGNKIAKSCKGLPLAIVVIGGLLKMSPKTYQYWATVAENVSYTISTEDDGKSLEILSLSYSDLPIHLKAFFLYMAAFQDLGTHFTLHDLTKVWVSDGILKPTEDRIMEDVVREYVDDLVCRNLIMRRHMQDYEPSFEIHDLLREFAQREARNEKFLHMIKDDWPMLRGICYREVQNEKLLRGMKDEGRTFPQTIESERRVVYLSSFEYRCFTFLPSMPHARSIVGKAWNSAQLASGCQLLRVVYVKPYFKLAPDIVQLVNIRVLHICYQSDLNMFLRSLSLFWNLESLTLDLKGYLDPICFLPYDIWGLPNLRDLDLNQRAILPDPRPGQIYCVLTNLHNISGAVDLYCTDEVLRLIPNLKELRTCYGLHTLSMYASKLSLCFANLARLPKLERLDVSFDCCPEEENCVFSNPESVVFSCNLRILTLSSCRIPWANMTIIGSLPNLEELNIHDNAFWGNVWSSNEGEFQRLKRLSICRCHILIWRVESCHFQKLEYLKVDTLKLKQIPLGIGDIPSLERILLYTDEISTVISAKVMLEEQRKLGNNDLVIGGLYRSWEVGKPEIEEWAEADTHFQVKFKSFYNKLFEV